MPGRERELFAVLAERAGVVAAHVQQLESALFERFELDRDPYYDALEPSLSGADERVDTYRFSYGFPAFRRDRSAVTAVVLAIARTCGDAAIIAARRALLASERDCVEQPIVGYSHDGPGQRRFKLYLMFRSGHDPAARALTREVVGGSHEPRQSGELHMLGLDVGDRGVTGAKLYFEHPTLELSADYTSRPLVLKRSLAIHALRAPDDAARDPVAMDFSLRDSGHSWADLEAGLAGEQPETIRTFRDLRARFGLQARRLSFFRGEPRKLNLYYVLDPPGLGSTPPL